MSDSDNSNDSDNSDKDEIDKPILSYDEHPDGDVLVQSNKKKIIWYIHAETYDERKQNISFDFYSLKFSIFH